MRTTILRAWGFVAMIGVTFSLWAQANAAPASNKGRIDFSSIESRLTAECASEEFSGVVVVKRPDGQVFRHVCGAAAKGAPITLDTRFKMFSTTKFLTAVTVMRLVEMGKIDLDSSIATYIPEVPPSWRAVTVHQLLHHVSGLPDQTERVLALYKSDYPTALAAVLAEDRAREIGPEATPGTVWKYNNFGYDLLATAAANVMHRPYEAVIDQLVFRPAAMTGATVERPRIIDGKLGSEPEADLAQGYNGTPAKKEPATSFEFVQLGAGSVHAKASDFLALDAALKSGKLLRPATLAQMEADMVPTGPETPPGRGYGLGMMIRGQAPLKYVGHDGGNNGFCTDFERFPDGTVLIAMSNLGYATNIDWIRVAVAEKLAAN
jgi:D-alanyl-D-alanine carboxypeptidase